MSWLWLVWRALKKTTGATDAELAFAAVASQLNSAEKATFVRGLQSVKFVIDLARLTSRDPRIEEADAWATEALTILNR